VQRDHAAARRADPHAVKHPAALQDHPLLDLQRRLGNHAVQRMLVARKEAPKPTVLGDSPVTKLDGATDAKTWAEQVRARQYLPLYAEIATLVQADRQEDVKATGGKVNAARRAAFDELKPGLNFVGGVSSRGQCGYLYDGKFDAKLPVTRDGPLPTVALLLSTRAFEPDNKSFTLGVLRHELEHATHNRMAIGWLQRWREDARAAKAKTPFASWLDKQTMSPVDRALVKERVTGGVSSTEALANVEGFMAAFRVEGPGVALADNPATEELGDAADYWLAADKAVQQELITRLRAYAAGLTGERRDTFRAALQALKAKNKALAPLADPLLKAK
jgi:hypothetical protein